MSRVVFGRGRQLTNGEGIVIWHGRVNRINLQRFDLFSPFLQAQILLIVLIGALCRQEDLSTIKKIYYHLRENDAGYHFKCNQREENTSLTEKRIGPKSMDILMNEEGEFILVEQKNIQFI